MRAPPSTSIIIPAANEEHYLVQALDSIDRQSVAPAEVIVVVNGSTDRTRDVAEARADKVLVYPDLLGPSRARNEGARVAVGELLVFLDADSHLSENTVEEITKIFTPTLLGTVAGSPDEARLKYRLYYQIKAGCLRSHLYRGVMSGLLFVPTQLFRRINGFDPDLLVGEYSDLISRARRAGGTYRFLATTTVKTSMRRFERHGLLPVFWFWIQWQIREVLGMQDGLGETYVCDRMREEDPSKIARARRPRWSSRTTIPSSVRRSGSSSSS